MAAQEYYNSFNTGNFGPPAGYPPQQRPPQLHHGAQRPVSQVPSQAPPPYSPYDANAPPVPQMQPHAVANGPSQPYGGPVRPPQQQTSSYLSADGPTLKPPRSHSSPPGHHDSKYMPSKSYSRSPSRSRRRKHSHSRPRDDSYYSSGGYSRERADSYDRDRTGYRDKKSHKDVDTFIGAGGGALVGDAIFPGLGTVGGLLLGGYGGRKYGQKKEQKMNGETSQGRFETWKDEARDMKGRMRHGEGGQRSQLSWKDEARDMKERMRHGNRSALAVDGYDGDRRRSRSNVGEYRYKR